MKLPIKKEYFDQIKAGEKKVEYRDAHITFVCEETGETLKKKISYATTIPYLWLDDDLKESGLFEDEDILMLGLEEDD